MGLKNKMCKSSQQSAHKSFLIKQIRSDQEDGEEEEMRRTKILSAEGENTGGGEKREGNGRGESRGRNTNGGTTERRKNENREKEMRKHKRSRKHMSQHGEKEIRGGNTSRRRTETSFKIFLSMGIR